MILDEQRAVSAFLTDPARLGLPPGTRVAEIDTHMSRVFLAGDRVYKLKRAVKLPYADLSTPEIRLATCEKELALNAPHAPGLYHAVRRVTRTGAGGLEFDGTGPLVDAVVEMARFDEDALLDNLARQGALSDALMADLAVAIADFHDQAPPVREISGSANLAAVLDINRAGFAASAVFSRAEADRLDSAFRAALDRHRAALDRRGAAGLVRRCHGDLHLRNICLFEGRPTLFDCIDFNDQIATVDTLYDLAFLLMDLWHRGLTRQASLVANRYFDHMGEDADFALLPFFMALRAAVRAHVTATMSEDAEATAPGQAEEARAYFDMAQALLAEPEPAVLAIGGISGTGKSTVAEALAPRIGLPPGARIVESDRTRKAMFGVAAETRLPPHAYAPDVSDRVYAVLGQRARALAEAGAPVIVDAVFDRADRRRALEAALAGWPVAGFWLTARPETLRARVEARTEARAGPRAGPRTGPRAGPSDADLAVLEAQLARDPGLVTWTRIASDGPLPAVLAAILRPRDGGAPGPGQAACA